MTHALGYFGPSLHIPRRRRLPSFLVSLGVGAILGLAGFVLLGVVMSMGVSSHTEAPDARVLAANGDHAVEWYFGHELEKRVLDRRERAEMIEIADVWVDVSSCFAWHADTTESVDGVFRLLYPFL